MKKLFILLGIILVLCSCCGNHHECASTNGTNATYVKGSTCNTKIQKINYEGHSYIFVTSQWYEGVGVGFVHDPDCNCGKH